jgi:hypothetical protein
LWDAAYNKSQANQEMVGGAVFEKDGPVIRLGDGIVDEAVEDVEDEAV